MRRCRRRSATPSFPTRASTADANLLIMPNVDAANITYNALRVTAGGGITVGGILLGAAKPVHILTPSSTVRRIVNMTAVAVADAGAQARAAWRSTGCAPPRARAVHAQVSEHGGDDHGSRKQAAVQVALFPGRSSPSSSASCSATSIPQTGEAMKPLGDGFIKLIKMIIAPIIFCTVVVGIAGMEDMKKVGKTGGYALLYFEIVSTIALIVGLIIVNIVQPGAGMNIDPATLDTKGIAAYTKPGQMQSTTDFLLNIIPNTVVDAFAKGEILQVLLFAVLFGFALHKFGGRGTLVFDLIEKTSHVLFAIVGVIMKVAPIGAFGAMAFTIGKYGVGSLLSLGKLMGTFYLTCLIFIFVVLGPDRAVARLLDPRSSSATSRRSC